MIGMREQIARSHFEMERAQEMQNIKTMVGDNYVNRWPDSSRAMYRAAEKSTWDNIAQDRRYKHLATADVALACLLKPTDAMVDAAMDVGQAPLCDGEIRVIYSALIQAARDGK